MAKENPRLTCYLDLLKGKWILHYKNLGKKPSTFLKEVVQEQLKNFSVEMYSN